MKKLVFLLALIFSLESYSQALLPKRRIFSAGYTTAVSDFASGGYATTGLCLSYERTSYLLKYLGIGSVLSYQSHNVDNKKLEEDLLKKLPDATEVKAKNDGYSSLYFMYGAYGRLPFHEEKWEIHAKVGGGIMMGKMNETEVVVSPMDGSENLSDVYSKDLDFRLGYYAGAGIQYNALGKHLGLRLNAEYVSSGMEFRMRPSQQLLSEDFTNTNGFQFININLGLMIKIL